eukprot:COSAG01_NODE_15556_length_1324_cov_1.168163_4_plen_42_part_01
MTLGVSGIVVLPRGLTCRLRTSLLLGWEMQMTQHERKNALFN